MPWSSLGWEGYFWIVPFPSCAGVHDDCDWKEILPVGKKKYVFIVRTGLWYTEGSYQDPALYISVHFGCMYSNIILERSPVWYDCDVFRWWGQRPVCVPSPLKKRIICDFSCYYSQLLAIWYYFDQSLDTRTCWNWMSFWFHLSENCESKSWDWENPYPRGQSLITFFFIVCCPLVQEGSPIPSLVSGHYAHPLLMMSIDADPIS